MGVNGLWDFIHDYIPHCARSGVPVDSLVNSFQPIDSENLFYKHSMKLWESMIGNNPLTQDYSVLIQSLQRNILLKSLALLQKRIVPIFFLDGAPRTAKAGTLLARNAASKDKYTQLEQQLPRALSGQMTQTELAAFRILRMKCIPRISTFRGHVIGLLEMVGIPYHIAQHDAEQEASAATAQGIGHGVLSDDGDCFAFGATNIFRHFAGNSFTMYSFDVILRTLQSVNPAFDRESFVDMCILSGCDYGGRVGKYPGARNKIACKTAWNEYFSKGATRLEQIAPHLGLSLQQLDAELNYVEARSIFLQKISLPSFGLNPNWTDMTYKLPGMGFGDQLPHIKSVYASLGYSVEFRPEETYIDYSHLDTDISFD